jgi:metal-dependent amidase/aminoacylase/carboxypeptidase family protein
VSRSRDVAIIDAVHAQRDQIIETTRFINAHPEIAHDELASSAHLVDVLSGRLTVESPWSGMATGFAASLNGQAAGATVGIVAVYDAVAAPDGHGGLRGSHSCGHGPVSGAVVGAALALASIGGERIGRVVILGCPADELVSPRAIREGSGKAVALAAGGLDGIDFLLYAHPESGTGVWRDSRWMQLIDVTVAGRVDPASWDLPFANYRVDEYEPDEDSTRVTLRVLGGDSDEITRYAEDARGRIAATSWTPRTVVEGLRADPLVAAAAEQSLEALGIAYEPELPVMPFSTDFGTVSRRIPGAMIGFGRPGGWDVHFEAGEVQFNSPEGEELAVTMAGVLALAADRLTRTDQETGKASR